MGRAVAFFGMLLGERGVLTEASLFRTRPNHVHTYFIKYTAAEYATPKPDGSLTRLSPTRVRESGPRDYRLRALTPGPMQFLQVLWRVTSFPFVQSPLVLALQVLVDDEKEKGCVHLKVLQEPEAKKLVFAFVGLQKDKNMDEAIENFQ